MLKLPNDENAEGAKHFLQEIPDTNSHLGDRSELFISTVLPKFKIFEILEGSVNAMASMLQQEHFDSTDIHQFI